MNGLDSSASLGMTFWGSERYLGRPEWHVEWGAVIPQADRGRGRRMRWVAAFVGDDGYVMSLVLLHVRRRATHPHPWAPAFAGATVWWVAVFAGDDGCVVGFHCTRSRTSGMTLRSLQRRRLG